MASPDAEYRIAKWEQDNDRCPVHGGSFMECPDDQRDWFPQRRVCWPSAQLAAANRLYDKRHEDEPYHDGSETIWTEKPTRLTPFHFRDGVTIYLAETDENPDDDFLTNGVSRA